MKDIWRFNNGRCHATDQMKVDVTMEEPYARVISLESDYDEAIGGNYKAIALQRNAGQRTFVTVPGIGAARDNLEDMILEL